MSIATELPHHTSADRLSLTLFLAVAVHAIIVFGISFGPVDKAPSRSNTLDIVLVQHREEETPEKADYLAQANQHGGGESEEKVRTTTPLPAPFTSQEAAIVSATPPVQESPPVATDAPRNEESRSAPEKEKAETVLAQTKATTEHKVASESNAQRTPEKKREVEKQPKPALKPTPTQTINAMLLVQRSLEMASLSTEVDYKLKSYAKTPRRKWIRANTAEYEYASYMEAWRSKVERIGNLNYPDEARRKRLDGNLLLEVAINGNGTVHDIILRRSSGHKVLDDAAIRIVKLAAPFAPLPKGIREETDILHISRTWQFLRSNQLASR